MKKEKEPCGSFWVGMKDACLEANASEQATCVLNSTPIQLTR